MESQLKQKYEELKARQEACKDEVDALKTLNQSLEEENKELKKEPEVVFDPLDITELENRLWTWEDKSNGQVTLAEMRRHLIEVQTG